MITLLLRKTTLFGLLGLAVVAVVVGLASQRGGGAQLLLPDTQYSAKALCGVLQVSMGPVGPISANVRTAINVHNPNATFAEMEKKAVLAPPERDTTASRQPGPITLFEIAPDEAFEIDCPDIYTLLGPTAPEEVPAAPPGTGTCSDGIDNAGSLPGADMDDPACFVKGFVVISSVLDLDVVGVYSAQRVENALTPGVGHSIEVDTIEGRPIPPPVPSPSVYSAKFVCGDAGAGDPVEPGHYFTAINVHNPNVLAVDLMLEKKFVVARSELLPTYPPTSWFPETLPNDGAFEIDCADITQHLTAEGIPFGSFVKGFVVLRSNNEMDVFGVYVSTQEVALGIGPGGSPVGGVGLKIDIEPVDKSVVGP